MVQSKGTGQKLLFCRGGSRRGQEKGDRMAHSRGPWSTHSAPAFPVSPSSQPVSTQPPSPLCSGERRSRCALLCLTHSS